MSIIDIGAIIREVDEAIGKAAKEAGDEIQAAFNESVDNFYDSYHPSSYNRTLSTYRGSSAARNHRTHRKLGSMRHECGITVDSSYIGGNPYTKNPKHGWDPSVDFIFDRTFFQGIHGFNRGTIQKRNKRLPNNFIGPRQEPWVVGYNNTYSTAIRYALGQRIEYRTPVNSTPPDRLLTAKVNDIDGTIDDKVSKYLGW